MSRVPCGPLAPLARRVYVTG
ncbi:rCG33356 [Rattus norvegicus]|uniref:RCG33356 n=1 Tax=Rattus norvegicus TaxID=10116 RepID=A6HFA5_RAT|nr:rCG33356 [Rattus norvegicus]